MGRGADRRSKKRLSAWYSQLGDDVLTYLEYQEIRRYASFSDLAQVRLSEIGEPPAIPEVYGLLLHSRDLGVGLKAGGLEDQPFLLLQAWQICRDMEADFDAVIAPKLRVLYGTTPEE